THRVAEPDHQRLARLIDLEQRAVADDQQDHGDDGDHAAGETEPHRGPPVVAPAAGGLGRRVGSLSGRNGPTPGLFGPPSRMILSVRPSTRSSVSRYRRRRVTSGALAYSA